MHVPDENKPINGKQISRISGMENGSRLDSRILEEKIQKAVADGYEQLEVEAYGQHGIGGRLWPAGDRPIHVCIYGSPGQRAGSMGFPNTRIEIMGPAADDVGWLNAGAEITVHGHATNGVGNAMAQGKIYVGGNIGARGMTMTKQNPRFASPELWVLGSVGDYFAEFMAGGIAVICGHEPQNPDNVLGYRPCVGMVGGRLLFRGPHAGFSQADAKLEPIADDQWLWLVENINTFLHRIQRPHLFGQLTRRDQWQLLVARSPLEKAARAKRSMGSFRQEVWDKDLGAGGLIGDLTHIDRGPIPVITTGVLRRFVPLWENRKYQAPCEASCPTGIPVHDRWRLIREGRVDEAVDMALAYTPFPATVCGYLCSNICMQDCTRQTADLTPVDIRQLGKASLKAQPASLPSPTGKRIAVIGGGPAGISVAWQLRRHGHEAVVYDMEETLGGKIALVIPHSRIPKDVVGAELERIQKVIPHVYLQQRITSNDLEQLKLDYDAVVIAVGAQKPRILSVPGKERMIPALEFLRLSKEEKATVGKRVVIIGAGNVGCDVATEAHRLGAEEITLIDVQKPASFGTERKAAESVGASFRWPCFTRAVTDHGVELSTGEVIPADTVFISIGDQPELDFLPESVATQRGFVVVNDLQQTADPQIFAIGDAVKPGLLTDAIGAGRKAAQGITQMLSGNVTPAEERPIIDHSRIRLEYFDPRLMRFDDVQQCASQCVSCGTCRDCGVCVTICPVEAISKKENGGSDFEMAVDDDKCIGCGFCVGACPCGIWTLVENAPIA